MLAPEALAQENKTSSLSIQAWYNQVAEDAIEQFHQQMQPNVLISVYDSVSMLEVENAFLQAFQKKNCRTFLKRNKNTLSVDSLLEVSIDVKRVKERILYENSPGNMREKTTITVQWYNGQNASAGVVGPFENMEEQKVENIPVPSGNWFEKVVTPLLVIGSSVLIVYLFFVVRS